MSQEELLRTENEYLKNRIRETEVAYGEMKANFKRANVTIAQIQKAIYPERLEYLLWDYQRFVKRRIEERDGSTVHFEPGWAREFIGGLEVRSEPNWR